jgi:hypothetical protein
LDPDLNNFSDAPGQEVPDDEAAVVAADGQECAVSVELAADGHGDAVQCAVIFFRVILPE